LKGHCIVLGRCKGVVSTSVVVVRVYAVEEKVPEPVIEVGKKTERACKGDCSAGGKR